eukprot:scaffold329037_cov95-Tisochrysis_lutea.AAC.1
MSISGHWVETEVKEGAWAMVRYARACVRTREASPVLRPGQASYAWRSRSAVQRRPPIPLQLPMRRSERHGWTRRSAGPARSTSE